MPGGSKEVKLILTKTLTANSTGLLSNSAEIYEDYNKFAIEDTDKGNGKGQADLIISLNTGGAIMYIGIVIGSMLVLGGIIMIINTKVIKAGRRDA